MIHRVHSLYVFIHLCRTLTIYKLRFVYTMNVNKLLGTGENNND